MYTRVNQGLLPGRRGVLPGQRDQRGIQLHIIHVRGLVLQDFPQRTIEAAANQQHAAGLLVPEHGDMDQIFGGLLLIFGAEQSAIFVEVDLPANGGHGQVAIDGGSRSHEKLAGITPSGGAPLPTTGVGGE
ncbi:MAG: hypothetical protein BWX54_02311 [Verrucomicrobia bacterium ADurb.Bin018]|nr:MAG: hypothetical protein BWX54_02311 [Verrucomicrobia bacterium ADurb.Bin018]